MAVEVRFPFLGLIHPSKVEYVANRVDPQTRTLQARSTIHNNGYLKIGMLVRVDVLIPPVPSRTVIPTTQVAIMRGMHYAFVQPPDEQFRRRAVRISSVNDDRRRDRRGPPPGGSRGLEPADVLRRDRRFHGRREYLRDLIRELDDLARSGMHRP